MFPKAFDYLLPKNLKDALRMLREHGENARVIAGGQSLIPMMKLRFLALEQLIDLKEIHDLRGVEVLEEKVRVGSMVRHSEIERSDVIAKHVPLLRQVACEIADVQVRNRGTLGGALCQADPAGDWAVASLALAAEMRCVSENGERVIPAHEFFLDTYATALNSMEILADVRFPVPPPRSASAYVKIRKRSGDFAIASVAVQITRNEAGQCIKVGIGVGGAAPTPIVPLNISDFLNGKRLSKDVIGDACKMLAECVDPIEDLRGSAAYKRDIATVALERALSQISK